MQSHTSKKYAKLLNCSKIEGFKKQDLIDNSQNGKFITKMIRFYYAHITIKTKYY
jgi:hypothetical protein